MAHSNQHIRRGIHSPALYLVPAGLLLAASFPPFGYGLLAWVAFVPLLFLWDRASTFWNCVGPVCAAFMLAYALAFFWPILHAVDDGGLLAVSGLMIWPLVFGLAFGAGWLMVPRVGRAPAFAGIICLAVLGEWLLSIAPVQWPWTNLANTQMELPLIAQLAAVGGPSGISLWLFLVNGAFFALLRGRGFMHRTGALLLGAGLIGLVAASGYLSMDRLKEAETRQVAVVQPDVPVSAWRDPHDGERVDELLSLSDSLLTHIDPEIELILWPGEALPVFGHYSWREQMMDRLQGWTDDRGVELVTGAITPGTARDSWDRTISFHRSAVHFRPGTRPDVQHQHNLMPYVEDNRWHSPPRGLFEQVPSPEGISAFERGPTGQQARFNTASGVISVLLGSEALVHSSPTHRGAPEMFVLPQSSRAWTSVVWDEAGGTHAQLRAVSHRRPVITLMNGNQGLLVDATGVVSRIPATSPAAVLSVPVYNTTPLYARHPHALPVLLVVLLGFIIFSGWKAPLNAVRHVDPNRAVQRLRVRDAMRHIPH